MLGGASIATAAAGKFVGTLLPAPEWALTLGNFGISLALLFGVVQEREALRENLACPKKEAIIGAPGQKSRRAGERLYPFDI